MKMQSAVDEYLVEIEVRKYTPKTIRSYRCNLNLFCVFAQRNCTSRLSRRSRLQLCGSFHAA